MLRDTTSALVIMMVFKSMGSTYESGALNNYPTTSHFIIPSFCFSPLALMTFTRRRLSTGPL